MTTALTITDIVESTVHMFGMDRVLGVPLARLVRVVMAAPDVLVLYAEKAGLDESMVREARKVARCIVAGIEPDTVDGRTFFLPGVEP